MCRLLLFVGFIQVPWQFSGKGEPVLQALARLDEEIASSEKSHPAARLAVVTAEMDVIQQVTFYTDNNINITNRSS